LFALAEALHTHGYTREACRLAKQLAEEMLSASASSDTVHVQEHPVHHPRGIFLSNAAADTYLLTAALWVKKKYW